MVNTEMENAKVKNRNQRDYYNALLEAVWYKQMIEEACNGDLKDNNFRHMLSVGDCIHSYGASEMWGTYAMQCL